jgi:hypothetical protein
MPYTERMARHRIILIPLLVWALVMIVPGLWRVVQPLASFGFSANNDGLIYDVRKPFDELAQSPAWREGVRKGDRLDMTKLGCMPFEPTACGNTLAVLGGRQFVLPGRSVTLDILAGAAQLPRRVTLLAEPEPSNPFERFVVALDQIAGILVVLAAAWLVWTRPGPMSWGFFLYVMWFNPGQTYTFQAILQQWPALLLAQNAAATVAEAAGYVGLLLFVMRAPNGRRDPKWRWLERALPLIGIALTLGLTASYGSLFDYQTEAGTRRAIFTGFVVALFAVGILLERRRRQSPEDYQRLRWVLWGCLIGLPVFIVAEFAQTTTVFQTRFGDFTPPDDAIGLLYLVNGVLCLFVFEAIRRARVVSVSIPLRRVTILGVTLSIPALFLHHKVEYMQDHLAIPNWAWIVIGAISLYVISRLHEAATHLCDRYFNRELDRVGDDLGAAILNAKSAVEIERLLADEPFRALALTSAAAFRRNGDAFHRYGKANGWDGAEARTIAADDSLLTPLAKGSPFPIAGEDDETSAAELKLPPGLARPIVAVPAANPLHCFAVTLYGPHASGTDLDADERAMLGRIAGQAAAVYAGLESGKLRERIVELEREVAEARPKGGPKRKRSA